MKILGIEASLSKLQHTLDISSKAYFVRFGDGESLLMDGSLQQTKGNKQKNSVALRKELNESLNINDPLYLRAASGSYPLEPGMIPGLFAPFENRAELDRILEEQLGKDVDEFLNPVLFHYLGVFAPKALRMFIDRNIRHEPKMFVGSCSKEAMKHFFGQIDYYAETPEANSFASINSWWSEIAKQSANVHTIILATGQASRVVAKRLWNMHADVHCIDIGSIVDPVNGKFDTRTCWKLKGEEVQRYFCG